MSCAIQARFRAIYNSMACLNHLVDELDRITRLNCESHDSNNYALRYAWELGVKVKDVKGTRKGGDWRWISFPLLCDIYSR